MLSVTSEQKSLLYHAGLADSLDSDYLVQMVFTLQAELDPTIFQSAWQYIVQRHEVLRLTLGGKVERGGLYSEQIINDQVSVGITWEDHRQYSLSESNAKFQSFLEQDLNQPMPLTQAPLMRFHVIQRGATDYRFVWTRHHILMGGASVLSVIQEFWSVYRALLAGELPRLSPRTPYRDALQAIPPLSPIDPVRAYWQSLLPTQARYSEVGFLPAVVRAPQTTSMDFSEEYFSLDAETYTSLVHFSQDKGLSFNTLLQAAWGLALQHYTGKSDVLFGSVRAYPQSLIKDAIGLFINTLPVALHFDPDLSVADYLSQIRIQQNFQRTYVQTELSAIRQWCEVPLDTPLFQSIIDFKTISAETALSEKFPEFPMHIDAHMRVPFHLILEVVAVPEGMQAKLRYNQNILKPSLLRSFAADFQRILQSLPDFFAEKVHAIPTLSNTAQRTILVDWNDTKADFPDNKTVTQLFEERAKTLPNATACVWESGTFTYSDLNQQANQWAHYLVQKGVKPGDFVALCFESKIKMILATLAVLKTGAAYLPIDPVHPDKRIAFLLEDSAAPWLLTEKTQYPRMQALTINSTPLCCIDVDSVDGSRESKDNLDIPLSASDVMYIIYTSGTTGTPKGVVVEHRGVVSMIYALARRFRVNSQTRILQQASFNFDLAVGEWVLALSMGAALYLIPRERRFVHLLLDWLKKYKITLLMIVPSLLTALKKEALPDLKILVACGEACTQELVSLWSKGREFFNMYGVTETTVFSTLFYCTAEDPRLPIGRPIANTQILILDKQMRPVPLGVIGDIYIGGIGVSRGYLNRSALTEEKFIAYSLPDENLKPGAPLPFYKTQDLGYWLPDGNIEYIGRGDMQFKIRGFRVEAGEIAAVLESYPGILKACVVLKPISGADPELYAYVVAENSVVINDQHLFLFLQEYLPYYMLPSHIECLDTLPVTINGKVDTELLVQRPLVTPKILQTKQPQNTSLESAIIDVLLPLLECSSIARNENLFSLGLRSLNILAFVQALEPIVGERVSIAAVFAYPTVAGLANYLSAALSKKVAQEEEEVS